MRVAACVVGAPRGLGLHHQHTLRAFPTDMHVDYFFCLSSGGGALNSKHQAYIDLPIHETLATMRSYAPRRIANVSVSFERVEACHTPKWMLDAKFDRSDQAVLVRVWETMATLKRCFDLVVSHEAETNAMYDIVVRLRPDVVFFAPLPPQVFRPNVTTFPKHGVACSSCLNDHMAFLPRAHAATYFSMADDYVYCRGRPPSMLSIGHVLPTRFRSVSHVSAEGVQYTLMRPHGSGFAPDCPRAGFIVGRNERDHARTAVCEAWAKLALGPSAGRTASAPSA